MDQEKRRHREMKRDVKKAGQRKLRRALDRALQQSPEDAADVEIDYGRDSSAPLNGADKDATRRPKPDEG
ncbi:MAG: hypothetical protein ACRC33_08600 [Gemmataceae bacterium]